jgi:hypothetical protein
MSKFTNPLSSVKIASPCSQNWDEMIGTERKRFCGECKLNVYNLSGMSPREAENLLINSEGRLCVRFYRRADGSVLTKDCPVGWQAIKRRASKTATAFASLVFATLSGIGLTNYFAKASEPQAMGAVPPLIESSITGKVAVEETNPDIENLGEYGDVMGGISSEQFRRSQPTVGRIVTIKRSINKKHKH